jgi:hypothetical protein
MLALRVLAGLVVGTTVVSVVLIHPLLYANAHRRRRTHPAVALAG